MEAVKKLNEDFLSCSICTDRYTDPCSLGCGHTFCKGCLAEFTKTRPDAIQAKSLLCPMCRQMTKAPDPSKPVEEWTKPMKPHFLIQGLLDTIGESDGRAPGATGVPTGTPCFPCQQIGKTAQALCVCKECDITLCEDCIKMHQTMPGTSRHVISDISGDGKAKSRRIVICHEHKSPVEFCCKDCNKAICSKCCIIYHRKCASVITIESMMTEITSVVREKQGTVAEAVEELKTNIALKEALIGKVGSNKSSLKSEISRVSQQAIATIKQKEKDLMDEVNKLTEKQTEQLRGQKKAEEIDLQMYEQYSEFINHALKSESQMDLYDVYQMFQSGAVKGPVKSDLSTRSPNEQVELVDKLDQQLFRTSISLGSLVVKKDHRDQKRSLKLHHTIDLRTKGKKKPTPVDVTVLDADGVVTVVVADQNDDSLKAFYIRENQARTSKLKLSYTPRTITRKSNNQIVVSVSSSRFFTVQVASDLTLLSAIKTQKVYDSLAVVSTSTLAAGCRKPSCIDILDMTGNVIRSVSPSASRGNLIREPKFMCTTNKGNVVVSDGGSNSVYCVTPGDGQIFPLLSDRSLSGVEGIVATESGDFLVVNYLTEAVLQLTESGSFRKYLLTAKDGLIGPFGICPYHDKLYVTEYDNGTVKVFRFH